MDNKEFVSKLTEIATKYKTLYVMGCFGAPMTVANKARYCKNHPYNTDPARKSMINSATPDTFGFDCVCLIKAVLWGWNGNASHVYGGASYASNNVPDINADVMITRCSNLSTDFSKIEVGEAVWVQGHIGVYIGNGLAVECTPAWGNKVQITACNCFKKGYNTRYWTKHGKLPYVTYETTPKKETTTTQTSKFKVGDVVRIVGEKYNPTSPTVPDWVKNDYTHIITQTTFNGNKVIKGGKECVLLGKRISNSTKVQSTGVNTWVAIDCIVLASTPNTPTYRTYTVVSGDSLWSIAQKTLGDGSRYAEIRELNKLPSNLIHAGNVLKIPNK